MKEKEGDTNRPCCSWNILHHSSPENNKNIWGGTVKEKKWAVIWDEKEERQSHGEWFLPHTYTKSLFFSFGEAKNWTKLFLTLLQCLYKTKEGVLFLTQAPTSWIYFRSSRRHAFVIQSNEEVSHILQHVRMHNIIIQELKMLSMENKTCSISKQM